MDEEVLREAVLSCPTQATILEEVEELLPWQLRSRQAAGPVRVAQAATPRFPASEPRQVTLKGIAEPMEVVSIQWR